MKVLLSEDEQSTRLKTVAKGISEFDRVDADK